MNQEVVTQAEFARIIRRDAAWVSRLRAAGRLVMDDNDLVRVQESVAKIEATAGHRDDLRQRHEAKRNGSKPDAARSPADDELAAARRRKALAESKIKELEAERSQIENDTRLGLLVAAEDVEVALRDLGAAVRAQIDTFPDQAAPPIAARLGVTDLEPIVLALEEECRGLLLRISESLTRREDAFRGQ